MKIINLGSGSVGNCTCIFNSNTSILIDQGLGYRTLLQRTRKVGIELEKINAVFVTHEHIDHIRGIESFYNRFKTPIYMQKDSFFKSSMTGIEPKEYDFVAPIQVGSFMIEPFRVPHDAAMTFGYIVSDGVKKIGYATDLGMVSSNTLKKLSSAKAVILESNHDEALLKANKMYPLCLKKRIMGVNGHLSNETCANTIVSLVKSGVERVMLAHLSEKNNYPELAFDTAVNILRDNEIKEGKDVKIDVATQNNISNMIEI